VAAVLFTLVGCAPVGADSGADSEDNRSVEETREDVCAGAAAIITANTGVMTKMRKNVALGFFDWDAGTFWDQGDIIAEFAEPLQDSAHGDDPNFGTAVNSLAFAYSEFSFSRFSEEAGPDWIKTSKRYRTISDSLRYALDDIEPFCR